jgi:phosphoketolase
MSRNQGMPCPAEGANPMSPATAKRRPASAGYPWLIHRLTYRRTNHDNLHVRGYKDEGTTTTPFACRSSARAPPTSSRRYATS